jgi:hypothetical protein
VNFDDAMRAAAHAADEAVSAVISKWDEGGVTDEDDITPYLVARLDARMEGQIGGLNWTSSVMRHRKGVAAEEKRTGADMLFHVTVNTNSKSFSKGVLIQAKRSHVSGRTNEYERLKEQCDDMLNITPAAFVFDYGPNEVRCGSALKIAGSTGPNLRREYTWTSYRFFLEFFRCPVGDRTITSASFDDLVVTHGLRMRAEGDVDD